jgi:hypothetical protein
MGYYIVKHGFMEETRVYNRRTQVYELPKTPNTVQLEIER